MRFVDEARIHVASGAGGAGIVSFRREKFVPRGGPDGGDGGRGGHIIIKVDRSLATLLDLRYQRLHRATNGTPGRGDNRTGGAGADRIIRVPQGTQIRDAENSEVLWDLCERDSQIVVARGGRGGRGNARFATATRRAPEHAQPGEPGVELELRLELKLLADVGLIGFPNAGKSTLISRISRARPKIADYPFTTLVPNLGVVRVADDRSYVVADIPGIVVGAAKGDGLGARFLRHVERTRLFLFLITLDLTPGRDPISDFHALQQELLVHDPSLLDRASMVVLTQMDRPEVAELLPLVREKLEPSMGRIYPISAVTGHGLTELRRAIATQLAAAGQWGQQIGL